MIYFCISFIKVLSHSIVHFQKINIQYLVYKKNLFVKSLCRPQTTNIHVFAVFSLLLSCCCGECFLLSPQRITEYTVSCSCGYKMTTIQLHMTDKAQEKYTLWIYRNIPNIWHIVDLLLYIETKFSFCCIHKT